MSMIIKRINNKFFHLAGENKTRGAVRKLISLDNYVVFI